MHMSLHAVQLIEQLLTEYIASIEPKQKATDAFNAHCQK